MKKGLAILLCLAMTAMLFGCSGSVPQQKLGQAENEILTYEPIDPEKTTLIVSTVGGISDVERLAEGFEAKNPDVQVVAMDITGGNAFVKPVVDWVEKGMKPDVMFMHPSFFESDELVKTQFEDLSGNPVVANYDAEALNRAAIDANIYMLPGPSSVYCMHYNKTMFEEHGWEYPETFDEFVKLCVRIREETGGEIQPWNPGAKYDGTFGAAMMCFTYEELFAGLDNRTWYRQFMEGTETFTGHMEPYYETLQTLIDNKILLEEHFTYSATTRGQEFADGKIAMYNHEISSFPESKYEIGYMPLPYTAGDGGYLNSSMATMLSVPKQEHSEKQRDAIDRFLAFFSSVEGQELYIGKRIMFSNVKGVPISGADNLKELQTAIGNGHTFETIGFWRKNGARPALHSDALAMVKGTRTAAQCIAEVDNNVYTMPEEEAKLMQPVATAAEDFTVLETSFFLADMYREKAGAEIGLITHNGIYRGNMMRIFKGDLTGNHVITLRPRSFENGSTLVRLSMTGQQLLDALNDPLNEPDCVYAYSGLKGEVAPWRGMGEKYVSLTLADGTPIDPNKLYTVAAWDGTVLDQYITEKQSAYDGSFEELLTETLQEKSPISPPKDGRMKLIWD